MAWELKDEWIDLAQARHVVVFHNKDIEIATQKGSSSSQSPRFAEHHLIHEFKLPACSHCGQVKEDAATDLDFATLKAETLEKLKQHHQLLMRYREKHPAARLHHGPR